LKLPTAVLVFYSDLLAIKFLFTNGYLVLPVYSLSIVVLFMGLNRYCYFNQDLRKSINLLDTNERPQVSFWFRR